jgi:hypothetical protein
MSDKYDDIDLDDEEEQEEIIVYESVEVRLQHLEFKVQELEAFVDWYRDPAHHLRNT